MYTIRQAIKRSVKTFKTERMEWDDEDGHHVQESCEQGPFMFSEFLVSIMGVFLQLYLEHPYLFTFGYEVSNGDGEVAYTPADDTLENAKALFSGLDFMGHAKMMISVNSFMRWLLKQEAVNDYDRDDYWYMLPTLINMWNAYTEASDGDIFRGPET